VVELARLSLYLVTT